MMNICVELFDNMFYLEVIEFIDLFCVMEFFVEEDLDIQIGIKN